MPKPLPVFSHDGDHEPLAVITMDDAVARVYRTPSGFVLTGKTDDDPREFEFHTFSTYMEALFVVANVVEMENTLPVHVMQL